MISAPDPRGGDGRKPRAPQPDCGPARGSEPWRVRCVVRGTGNPVAMTLDFAGGVTATSLAMGRIAIRVPGVGMSLPSDRHTSMFGTCGEGAKRPRPPRSDCGDIPGREAWHPSAHSKGANAFPGLPSPGPLVKTSACGGQVPARSPCGVAPCLDRRTCVTGMPLFSSASELPHEVPRHPDDRGGRIWLN